MTSSNGALNGTLAPCNIGSARIASLLLGNKLENGEGLVGCEERDLLSCTEFHNCVECSFDIDIIPFAVPFRMKSACSNPRQCPFLTRILQIHTSFILL